MPTCELFPVEFIDMKGVGIPETAETVTYSALSYVWGQDPPRSSILCNGVPLKIPRNLADALYRLAESGQTLHLWCDALCINQEDEAEKSSQVRNMLRIFEKADSVIAWLGEPIAQSGSFARDGLRVLSLNSPTISEMIEHDLSVSKGTLCAAHFARVQCWILSVLDNEWWSRTWIRQEVFGAKKIVLRLGKWTYDFELIISRIADILRFWDREGWPTTDLAIGTRCRIMSQHFQHQGTDNHRFGPPVHRKTYTRHWLDTLHDGAVFGATDPRDRVYGILGIVSSPTARLYVDSPAANRFEPLPIDYGKSVSEVYEDVVKFLINSDRSLDCLTVFEDRRGRSTDLPSWVTDWRLKNSRCFFSASQYAERSKFASKVPATQDFADRGRLRLLGIQCYDPICAIDGRASTYSAMVPESPNAGTAESRGPEVGLKIALTEIIRSVLHIDDTGGLSKTSSYVWALLLPAEQVLPGKRSQKSKMAFLVPRTIMIDDIMVDFQGGGCPFILRPVGNGQHNLIGPCLIVKVPRYRGGLTVANMRDSFVDWNAPKIQGSSKEYIIV